MGETVTMTLSEFLEARIAEDAAVAEAAIKAVANDDGRWGVVGKRDSYDECRIEGRALIIYDESGHDHDQALHIARHDPARVLAECAAKRRIVDLAVDAEKHTQIDLPKNYMRATLHALASVYADHPDYRAEWAS